MPEKRNVAEIVRSSLSMNQEEKGALLVILAHLNIQTLLDEFDRLYNKSLTIKIEEPEIDDMVLQKLSSPIKELQKIVSTSKAKIDLGLKHKVTSDYITEFKSDLETGIQVVNNLNSKGVPLVKTWSEHFELLHPQTDDQATLEQLKIDATNKVSHDFETFLDTLKAVSLGTDDDADTVFLRKTLADMGYDLARNMESYADIAEEKPNSPELFLKKQELDLIKTLKKMGLKKPESIVKSNKSSEQMGSQSLMEKAQGMWSSLRDRTTTKPQELPVQTQTARLKQQIAWLYNFTDKIEVFPIHLIKKYVENKAAEKQIAEAIPEKRDEQARITVKLLDEFHNVVKWVPKSSETQKATQFKVELLVLQANRVCEIKNETRPAPPKPEDSNDLIPWLDNSIAAQTRIKTAQESAETESSNELIKMQALMRTCNAILNATYTSEKENQRTQFKQALNNAKKIGELLPKSQRPPTDFLKKYQDDYDLLFEIKSDARQAQTLPSTSHVEKKHEDKPKSPLLAYFQEVSTSMHHLIETGKTALSRKDSKNVFSLPPEDMFQTEELLPVEHLTSIKDITLKAVTELELIVTEGKNILKAEGKNLYRILDIKFEAVRSKIQVAQVSKENPFIKQFVSENSRLTLQFSTLQIMLNQMDELTDADKIDESYRKNFIQQARIDTDIDKLDSIAKDVKDYEDRLNSDLFQTASLVMTNLAVEYMRIYNKRIHWDDQMEDHLSKNYVTSLFDYRNSADPLEEQLQLMNAIDPRLGKLFSIHQHIKQINNRYLNKNLNLLNDETYRNDLINFIQKDFQNEEMEQMSKSSRNALTHYLRIHVLKPLYLTLKKIEDKAGTLLHNFKRCLIDPSLPPRVNQPANFFKTLQTPSPYKTEKRLLQIRETALNQLRP